MQDIKSIAPFLGLLVALGWGFNSAVTAQNYAARLVNIPTDIMAIGLAVILAGFSMSFFLNQPIQLGLFVTSPGRIWLWATALSFAACMTLIRLSFAETNATYTVLLECSYALFTPLFSWLLFQQKQLTLPMMIGGAFILIGVFLVMSSQIQKTSHGA